MNAIDFNKIDKQLDKILELSKLDLNKRILLLESQIHTIYSNWNDSVNKTINIMDNNSCLNLDEKIIFYDLLLSKSIWTNNKIDLPHSIPEKMSQWRIYNCNLGYNVGSEQNKRRPVLILNNFNIINSPLAIIAPIVGSGKQTYKPEIEILETAYGNVYGKVDLSQMRSVSFDRLDVKPFDRLMTKEEYEKKYKGKKYTMMQDVIKRRIKKIFGIDI